VVVLIIGITAAMATPTLTKQFLERRSGDAAQRIALLYSSARMRALGRGSAVLVRYSKDSRTFSVLESMEGAAVASIGVGENENCAPRPGLGCLTNNWAAGSTITRPVTSFTPPPELEVATFAPTGAGVDNISICFTPLGRSFMTTIADGVPTAPMVGAPTITVKRTTGGQGLTRTIAILPNGMARLAR